MKDACFLCFLCYALVGLTACALTTDITSNPDGHTDFVPGRLYRLKQPLYLFTFDKKDSKEIPRLEKLGSRGKPTDVSELRAAEKTDSQISGLMMPEDTVRVTRLLDDHVPEIGTVLVVSGVVVSGAERGKAVELQLIRKNIFPASEAFVDQRFLEPVNDGN